jgi:branched-chain amino acid transport system permease protein
MHSFGHAAYFGLGAYAAALLLKRGGLPMEAALLLAPLVRRSARWCSAGSACGCRASIWPCSRWPSRRSPGRRASSGTVTGGSNGWSACGLRRGSPTRAPTTIWRTSAGGAGRAAAAAGAVLALRLRAARRPRFAAARRSHRHRRAGVQWAALCWSARWLGWRARCMPSPRAAFRPSISSRKSVDGLVMVLLGGVQTLAGPVVGAAIFTWLQRRRGAQHRILARRAGRHHPAAGAAVPAGAGRFCLKALVARWQEQRLHEPPLLQVDGPCTSVRRRAGGRWRRLFAGGRRDAGADRPERRRQVHLLQHAERPAAARCGHRAAGRDIVGLPPRAIWRLGVGRTFQITATFAR